MVKDKSCISCAYYEPFDTPVIREEYGVWGKCRYGVADGKPGYNVYIPHGSCNRWKERTVGTDGREDPAGG